MNKQLIIFLVLILNVLLTDSLSAQNYCQSNRFVDINYFSKDKIQSDTSVTYGVAKDWLGKEDVQTFNIFYPKTAVDSLKNKPFVMLMHGGGFQTEEYINSKNIWNKVCYMLARMGYVAATIDYRVGWKGLNKEMSIDDRHESSGVFAAYRAYQDARAALRYFVHNASLYGIDTNNIFIGGRSAGGDISLTTVFLSQKDIDVLLASKIPAKCHKILGSIDSSTNTLTEKFKIRGIINMWSAIPDTAFISKEEALATPIIMFQGTDDKAVPYKMFAPPDYPSTRYGSFYIAQRYKHFGACYQLNTKLGGGHGEDFSNEFIANHASKFIKSILCNNCKSEEFETSIPFKVRIAKVLFSVAGICIFYSLVIICIVIYITLNKRKKNSM